MPAGRRLYGHRKVISRHKHTWIGTLPVNVTLLDTSGAISSIVGTYGPTTVGKALAGALSGAQKAVGALVRQPQTSYAGAMSAGRASAGSLSKQPQVSFNGAIGLAGALALAATYAAAMAGAISPAGAVAWSVLITFAAAMASAGSVKWALDKLFGGFSISDFPHNATTVTDNFNRSDESPIASPWDVTNWSGAEAVLSLNHFAAADRTGYFDGGANYGSAFTRDVEAVVEVGSFTASTGYLAEIGFNFAGGSPAGAVTAVPDSGEIRIYSSLGIAATFTATISAGDLIGVRRIGGFLQAWHKPGAGSWTFIGMNRDASLDSASLLPELYVYSNTEAAYVDNYRLAQVTGWSSALSLASTFVRTFAGALTSAGSLVFGRFLDATGSLATAGALTRDVGKAIAGSLTSAATVLKQVTQTYSADLDFSGALDAIRIVLLEVAGTLTSAAAITWSIGKQLAGSIASASSVAWSVATSYAGSLTSTGATSKQPQKSFAASLSSAGSFTASAVLALAGAVGSAGATSWSIAKSIAASLTSSGAITKSIGKAFDATITFAGDVANSLVKLLSVAGSIAMSATLTKQVGKALASTLTLAGVLTTNVTRLISFSGTLTSAGALTARAMLTLAGAVAYAGATSWTVGKGVAGSLSTAGAIAKKDVSKLLSGVLNLAGSLTFPGGAFLLDVAGFISSSSTISWHVATSYAGSLASAGALTAARIVQLIAAGTIAFSSAITWTVGKLVRGTVHGVGTVRWLVSVTFNGLLSLASRLRFGRRGRVGAHSALLAAVDTGAAPADAVGAEAALLDSVGTDVDLTGIVGADADAAFHVGTGNE